MAEQQKPETGVFNIHLLRNRLLLLMTVLFLLFSFFLFYLISFERESVKEIIGSSRREKETLLENIREISSRDMRIIAHYEYTMWDGMVNYIQNPTVAFEESNIDWLIDTYNFDAVWIFDNDFQLVYTVATAPRFEHFPYSEEQLEQIFNSAHLVEFYDDLEGSVLEIFGASIHYTDDNYRKDPPNGYMLIGRAIDRDYIEELERLSQTEIVLVRHGSAAPEDSNSPMIITKILPGLHNDTAAVLYADFSNELTHFTTDHKIDAPVIFLIFSIILLGFFFGFTYYFVVKPVRSITSYLETSDDSTMGELFNGQSEFGRIARLIRTFFKQKDALLSEIAIRQENERNLKKYDFIVNSTSDAMALIDDNYLLQAANNAFISFFSVKAPDIQDQDIRELEIQDEFQKRLIEKISAGLQGKSNHFIHEIPDSKGRSQCYEYYVHPYSEITGKTTHVVLVIKDISHLKIIERELKESEYRFQSLLDSLDDVVWSAHGINKNFHYINKSVEKLYGYSIEHFNQNKQLWLDVVHPEDKPRIEAKSNDLFKTHNFDEEYRIIRQDGSIRWVHERKKVFEDEKGNPVRIGGIVTDITERKKAREALAKSEQRFRLLFSSLGDVTFITSAEAHITDVNKAFLTVTGYSYEESKKLTLQDLLVEKPYVLKSLRTDLSDRNEIIFESNLQTKDNRIIPIELNQSITEINNVTVVINVARDISLRKEAEKALRKKIELEEFLLRISSAFLHSPAYKLGTEITNALKIAGSYLKVDRSFLVEVSEDGERYLNYYEWCADTIAPSEELDSDHKLKDMMPWLWKQLQQPDIIKIENMDQLPDEAAAEKGYLSSIGVKAFIVLPQFYSNKLIGYCGFDSLAERVWSDDIIAIIKLLGQIIGAVMQNKKYTLALSENEERFRGLYENATVGIYRSTPDGRLLMCNPAMLQMIGYSSFDEIKDLKIAEFGYINPADRKLFKDEVEKNGRVLGFESKYKKKGGDLIYIRESATCVYDKNHQAAYYEGVVENITEKKETELQLQKINEELELRVAERTAELNALILQAPMAIGIYNRKGKLTHRNFRFEALVEPALDADHSFDKLIEYCDLNNSEHNESIRLLFTKGGEYYIDAIQYPPSEFPSAGHSGEVWLRYNFYSIFSDAGDVASIVVFIEDITDVKRAEEAAEKIRRQRLIAGIMMEAQEEERKRVSRELHDGIAPMLFASSLHLDHFSNKGNNNIEQLEKAKSIINAAGKELRNIVHALHPLNIDKFGMEKAIELHCKEIAALHNIPINFMAFDISVKISTKIAASVYRIVQEALSNIVKHAKAEQVTVQIFSRENRILLLIEDDGSGFDVEKVRAETSKSFGLDNIYRRVDMLNGIIQIESSPGAGTEIHISIPLEAENG